MDIITPKPEALHDFEQITRLYEMELKKFLDEKNKIEPNIFDPTKFILEEIVELYGSIITLMKNNLMQPCLLITRPTKVLSSQIKKVGQIKDIKTKQAF